MPIDPQREHFERRDTELKRLLFVTSHCPTCGRPGVPLLFGLPVVEAQRAAEDRRLALGGCCIADGEPPNWECVKHHQWRDGSEDDHNAVILQILEAYGYQEAPDDE